MRIFNKLTIVTFAATLYLLLGSFNSFAQNVGINNTGATPDNSALLDLSSDDKGFLITRADTGNIASPAFGLMTLSPVDSCLYMFSGDSWISIGGVGVNCGSNDTGAGIGNETEIVDITSPGTGEIWMDRNLGASQVATSATDEEAYGDFYQWGRGTDGHQDRTSGTITTVSNSNTPGHDLFILGYDWRSPANNSLWQGVSGTNNPCPSGYRLPTEAELDAERASWDGESAAGAFASIKLPLAGLRDWGDGSFIDVGSFGFYWSSTVNGPESKYVGFFSTNDGMFSGNRTYGFSVRCIKD